MSETAIKTGKLPFDEGWKHALLEYRQAALWYAVIAFLNLSILAAVFFSKISFPAISFSEWRIGSLTILVPWLLVIFCASIGFLISLYQERQLKSPELYLGYVALAGMTQLIYFAVRPSSYGAVFWIAELLNNILLCLMSLEIGISLLPRRYLKIFALSLPIILALRLSARLPSPSALLLDLSAGASYGCGLLLCLVLFLRVKWTNEQKLVTAAVLVLLLSSLIQSFGLSLRLSVISGQIEPLIVIVLLVSAGRSRASAGIQAG